MNELLAKLISEHPDIEEEVSIAVNDVVLTCFNTVCPFKRFVGAKYLVEFSMLDFELFEVTSDEPCKRESKSKGDYCYEFVGILNGNVLDTVIPIHDEVFESEYSYLNGKNVRVIVERLEVWFLKEV